MLLLIFAHKHKDRNTKTHSCEHASLSPVSVFSSLSLSLARSLPPLEQLGQGRRSSYSFLMKLSLCHPGPQLHGGGDCWQENEAYEWVRSASDRFMGHHCQHSEGEQNVQASKPIRCPPIASLGASGVTGRIDALLTLTLTCNWSNLP